MSNKDSIRKEILTRLKSQPAAEKRAKSDNIRKKLFSTGQFNKARVVMFYVSTDEEADTRIMIKEALDSGKRVVVPSVNKETKEIVASELRELEGDLEKGTFGIYQPKQDRLREIPLEQIDLVIVPGVAFDKNNNRLGRGKGYYDKFLRRLSPDTVAIGICFDFQLLNKLPVDSHDRPVHQVITN